MKKSHTNIALVTLVILFSLICIQGQAQYYLGVRAGVNASKSTFQNKTYNKYIKSHFVPGFTVGPLATIERMEKYSITFEFLYSQKGRNVEATKNQDIQFIEARYHYLDFPILFKVKMKTRWEHVRWFINIGPEINYWLGGKGSFKVWDDNYKFYNKYTYKIAYGQMDETNPDLETLYIEEPIKLQIGLSIGGGVSFDLSDNEYILVDLRYTMGHSFMTKDGIATLAQLEDNYKSRTNVITLSAIYTANLFDKGKELKRRFSPYKIKKR